MRFAVVPMPSPTSKLYVTFTMDCERIEAFSPPGGPKTWDLSERAIRGFAQLLFNHRLVATFFIVPETAQRHRDLFLELQQRGFELGMHLHPQSFADQSHDEYLGAYSYEDQLDLLSQAAEAWAEALGRRPTTFRPGNFSASDGTFRALHEAGFRQGSVSAPERVMPGYRAVWAGADPYAHHAHPQFRLIPGDLDFYEVPVSEDWSRRIWDGKSAMELRVEAAGIQDHRQTIDTRLTDMLEKDIPVKTIVCITHNVFDYTDATNAQRITLDAIAAYVWEAAERSGLQVCPTTLQQLHQSVDRTSS